MTLEPTPAARVGIRARCAGSTNGNAPCSSVRAAHDHRPYLHHGNPGAESAKGGRLPGIQSLPHKYKRRDPNLAL